jgi:hypothetical protein
MYDISRALNKLLYKFLSQITRLSSLFEFPFVRQFRIILIAEPLFCRMIFEKVVRLLFLMNLLVVIIELLEFISCKRLHLYVLEHFKWDYRLIQPWHLVFNTLLEFSFIAVVSAPLVST